MYLFVTYATAGIKGVQARGIKIAKYFSKNEIFFINSGDDTWLKKNKLPYQNINFDALYNPSEIKIPNGTKKIIFCDAPTNKPYQTALMIAAQAKKIPCIVLGNIYNSKQLNEKVPSLTEKYCDLYLRTGLSYFKKVISEHNERVKYVPPFIVKPVLDDKEKHNILENFHLDKKDKIVLAMGYNEKVLKEIIKLEKILVKKNSNIKIVVLGVGQEIRQNKNIIFAPVQDETIYSKLMLLSKIVICKRGFLQVIESLSFGKPVVTLGEFKGYGKEWVDPVINDVVYHSDKIDQKIINIILETSSNSSKANNLENKIKKLHDGSFEGTKIAAELIEKCKFVHKKFTTKIAICLDGKNEILKLKKLIEKNTFVLPIIISLPYLSYGYATKEYFKQTFENEYADNLSSELNIRTKENLKYGFYQIYDFCFHDFHGSATILPFYKQLLTDIENKMKAADEVIVIGQKTLEAIKPLLKNKKYRLLN